MRLGRRDWWLESRLDWGFGNVNGRYLYLFAMVATNWGNCGWLMIGGNILRVCGGWDSEKHPGQNMRSKF